MWKLTIDPTIRLDKICNECNELIESFDENDNITGTIYQKVMSQNIALENLSFGLEPYHWHPVTKKYPNCLSPHNEPNEPIQNPFLDRKHEAELNEIKREVTIGLPTPTEYKQKEDIHKQLIKRGRPSYRQVTKKLNQRRKRMDTETNTEDIQKLTTTELLQKLDGLNEKETNNKDETTNST